MNGLQAAVQAAEDAAVAVRTYVPGYPITDLAQALACQISVNEKVALEIALGASATGLRSLVVVKQVGMNILADPLVISATHGIGSGLVVLVGDDLGPRGSQAEMDSRFYGPLRAAAARSPQPWSSSRRSSGGLHSFRVAQDSGHRQGDLPSSRCRGAAPPVPAPPGHGA
ncbi:MAG: hypothetical protein LUQ21_02060 [Methanothrix sp.]|nr:hypothetical protein [Methanothrix sp.]